MRLTPRRLIGPLLAVAAAVAIALLPLTLSDYNRSTGATVGVFFVAILALNIVTGYTGQISIGHGAFMAVGGYTTAILTHDHVWNDIATMPVALVVGFAAGVIVGLPALRFHGVYLALAAIGIGAHGLISGASNEAPLEVGRLVRAALDNQWTKALE